MRIMRYSWHLLNILSLPLLLFNSINHFRDVKGTVPKFSESFVNEGNCDMFQVMKTLKNIGFDGFMIPDHVPHIIDDTEWGHRGRAYTIGYMTAFLELLDSMA